MNTPQPINELWEYSISEVQEYIKQQKETLRTLLDPDQDQILIDRCQANINEWKQKRVSERV